MTYGNVTEDHSEWNHEKCEWDRWFQKLNTHILTEKKKEKKTPSIENIPLDVRTLSITEPLTREIRKHANKTTRISKYYVGDIIIWRPAWLKSRYRVRTCVRPTQQKHVHVRYKIKENSDTNWNKTLKKCYGGWVWGIE